MSVVGIVTLLTTAFSLNRSERRLAELDRLRNAAAREALKNENELRLITDQLPTLISYIDTEGRYIRVNRTYERWLGKSAREIVGKRVSDVVGEDYWASTQAARKAMPLGETVTFDTIFPTLRGDRHAQVTYAPDIDDTGTLRGYAVMVLDIHDRFQAERALLQTEKLAAVGRLASSIAHEINNPLEAVTNLLYLAEQDATEPAEARGFVQLAQTELARVTHIVTQTLRFHRQAANATQCKLSTIATQVVSLYQGRLAQKSIQVTERYRDTGTVLLRDGEIRQVLANLVGNAADAMDDRGTLHIRTRHTQHPQPGILVTIADTGHGIAAQTRSTLFEPFHTTKGATGSGLGLWISKEIIDRHHGTIHVRSSQDPAYHGTVFQIFLPHSTAVAASA